jgi:hypothetical protein
MTDTDKELLELAAKAAGIEGNQDVHGIWTQGSWEMGGVFWNPIEDDGDALRLAVELDMQVSIGFRRINVAVYLDRGGDELSFNSGGALPVNIREVKSNDPIAATRRAIVRAAAEIGRI